MIEMFIFEGIVKVMKFFRIKINNFVFIVVEVFF